MHETTITVCKKPHELQTRSHFLQIVHFLVQWGFIYTCTRFYVKIERKHSNLTWPTLIGYPLFPAAGARRPDSRRACCFLAKSSSLATRGGPPAFGVGNTLLPWRPADDVIDVLSESWLPLPLDLSSRALSCKIITCTLFKATNTYTLARRYPY